MVREIVHLSEEFWQAVVLRQKVLRAPLGLTLTVEEVLNEGSPQRHWGLWKDGRLAACLSSIPLAGNVAKLRQMAVSESFQRQGLGGQLLLQVEKMLRSEGMKSLELHARATAIHFYEKLGFHVVGNEFVEVGIPHVMMVK